MKFQNTLHAILTLALIAFVGFLAKREYVSEKQPVITTAAQVSDKAIDIDRYKTFSFFSATTTDATSTDTFTIQGAKKVELYFTRNASSTSVATSTFSVQVSPDGTDWYDYNKLISNVTNTNVQEETRVASVSITGATSTTITSLDIESDVFYSIRCVASNASTTIETDDSNTCTAAAEY